MRRRPSNLGRIAMLAIAVGVAAAGHAENAPEPSGSMWSAERRAEYRQWQDELRADLRVQLGIPDTKIELAPESRGLIERDGIVVEKWIISAESGSRVPCLLFRPENPNGKMPAIVLSFGHGGSKSFWSYQYAGQLFARLGVACLAMDPIGEEERHPNGHRGTREHDQPEVDHRAHALRRPVMGKLVFDAIRGIDFLLSRDDIDPARIGLAGNSLGGAVAQFTAAVEPRLRLVLVSGWMYDSYLAENSKRCTATPLQRAGDICTMEEMLALSAPECALLVMNGMADVIIENRPPVGMDEGGQAWSGNHRAVAAAKQVYSGLGADPSWVAEWFLEAAGHREYFNDKTALEWIHRHLGTPSMTLEEIRSLPTINSGEWCDAHRLQFERLYGTQLHQRGQSLPDLGLRPFSGSELAVLQHDELGQPQYTIDGWLDAVELARNEQK
ncbi:MAG: acetylxylan esterase [Pirellulales bacterium]